MTAQYLRRQAEQGVLVAVGDLVEDIVVWRTRDVHPGTDNEAAIFRSRGGSAANVAFFAADLVPSRFIGCVGEDAAATMLVAELTDRGVDVRVQRRGRTGTIVVLVDADGERTMYPDRAAAGQLQEVSDMWLVSAGCLHVPAYCFATEPTAGSVRRLIDSARRRGVPVSIDASSTGMITDYGVERFRQLLDSVQPQLLFANADEAALLDLANDRFSGTLTVVKDGPRPTAVRPVFGDELLVPVPPLAGVRDSTGAGDAFAAGFLSAWLGHSDLAECARFGHALARSVLLTPGAQSSSPVG
ncbi:sugar/nucleoside kinase (ribokinase family) [Jatrophihabitans sp. GAS493]|uniref:carbohydrate kinase family protein n=1 Tax=Jatrophihabitans sp. GAS493 TaxID=1907575 RepID=UPI000BB9212D|nr:PfkB family carbohydrate kinase [Jatrophihabitans sp. GAS493]SOD71724.1 sugar/nucleoside kinase (ribokinase family) [Jatrophihabitans sp. GAS493]